MTKANTHSVKLKEKIHYLCTFSSFSDVDLAMEAHL